MDSENGDHFVVCGYQSKSPIGNNEWSTCSKDFYEEVLASPDKWPGYSLRPIFAPAPKTPSSQWFSKKESDPFGAQYDCQRAALTLGQYTDDEIANGAFMNYDQPLDLERVMAGDKDYHAPIAWMQGVKDRIRWLSRSLNKSIQRVEMLEMTYVATQKGLDTTVQIMGAGNLQLRDQLDEARAELESLKGPVKTINELSGDVVITQKVNSDD